jgi:hypothetical protein
VANAGGHGLADEVHVGGRETVGAKSDARYLDAGKSESGHLVQG